MKKTILRKLLSVILCVGLCAAIALCAAGCTSGVGTPPAALGGGQTLTGGDLGEGKTEFTFLVVDGGDRETRFTIHTDQTTVGDALEELGLIAGEESEYGLYVKTVNGVTVDYDADGKYWAFYVDGEYASAGVDATEVTAGSTYSFVVE